MGIGAVAYRAQQRALMWRQHRRGVFGQYGEDEALDRLLGGQPTGFYVDVGAYDPTVFSNTRRFHDRGWHGINIEPDPAKIARFERDRPRDLNLCVGLSDRPAVLPYYRIDPDSLSTFDEQQANLAVAHGRILVAVEERETRTLADVLEEHAPDVIDFLSVDCEGFDLHVLRGGDWTRHRPRFVILEVNHDRERLDGFMGDVGYRAVYENGTNSIYQAQTPGNEAS